MDSITIVLADDHALVRGGLRRILDAEDDFHVVAEAGDADEALRIARDLRPRIVLLDEPMPGTPSIDAIPSLLGEAPGCAVVMLTMHDDSALVRKALAAATSRSSGRTSTSRRPPSSTSAQNCRPHSAKC